MGAKVFICLALTGSIFDLAVWGGETQKKEPVPFLVGVKGFLRRNLFAFAAFFVPFAVRLVPEVLAWPYLVGFDTVGYTTLIQQGFIYTFNAATFFRGFNFFYVVSGLPYSVVHDAVLIMKFLGPLLFGLLCYLFYVYARRALRWGSWKSLLVAVLICTYFVALRNSADLYRQATGLVFLMAAVIVLKSSRSPQKYFLAVALMVFTVLSHPLPTVVLFFFVLSELARFAYKRKAWDFVWMLASVAFPFWLFLFQLYSPKAGSLILPVASVAASASVELALYIGGSLVYCYAFVLVLVLLGLVFKFRDFFMISWASLCLLLVVLLVVNPNLPFYIWYRWVIFLVYPLLFFAVEGLDAIWRFSFRFKGKLKRFVPKFVVLVYVGLLLTLGGYYLASSPEHPFPYYSQYNSYLTSVPSSMLQNTISIEDNPSLVNCAQWINQNSPADSVVAEFHGLYDLAKVYVQNRTILYISQDTSTWSYVQNSSMAVNRLVEAAKEQLSEGKSGVYTIWWIGGEGWYGVSSLPSSFVEVYRFGHMAVYSFVFVG